MDSCKPDVLGYVDYSPAKKDDDSVALGRNEAEHEDVLAATVVALRRGLSKGTFCVQNDFFVFSAHEVVNDV